MPSEDARNDLMHVISQLEHNISSNSHDSSRTLLSQAKIALLKNDALIPSSSTPPQLLQTGQHILELGALISISLGDAPAFQRYFQQLQPFYSHATASSLQGQRSKITGLYLLLLLSQGDYAGFHTLLEGLEVQRDEHQKGIEEDEFVQYPVRLEQWLMEGSYDRVWEETKSERVPSPEFAIFSNILINTIRTEIASCSEKAYPSIPITNAKSLLFLDSEGSVIDFSQQRQGWQAHDNRLYFVGAGEDEGEDVAASGGSVIENALGYARELEMIV